MFALLFTALMISTDARNTSSVRPHAKVLGGYPSTIKEFPYVALIIKNIEKKKSISHFTGSILSDRYILTVAHGLLE